MKVSEDTNRDSIVLYKGADSGETDFIDCTVEASASMFKLLRSTIYTDKILAPIRELSCNAYDAQVKVGKQNIPIVITMPSHNNPVFAVTDCGAGMSAEQVITQFKCFGNSDKTESNEFVGFLGIGSKSPLCYTDSFTIVTTKEGVTSEFVCVLADGKPKLSSPTSKVTGEPSGTTVSFAVDPQDFTAFFRKCFSFFSTFTPFPKFIGANFVDPGTTKYSTLVSPAPKDGAGLSVLCGNVVYPFPISALESENRRKLEQLCYTYVATLVEVPIGSVDITASREALEATPKTIDTVVAALQEARDTAVKECEDVISAGGDFFDVLRGLAAVSDRSQGLRLPEHCSSYRYADAQLSKVGFDDLGYVQRMCLKYGSCGIRHTQSPSVLNASALVGNNIPSDGLDLFVLHTSRALKHSDTYRKYVDKLRQDTGKHQIMYVTDSASFLDCFRKLGIATIEEADLRAKLGFRALGASGVSKVTRPKLSLEGKDPNAVAAGWYRRTTDYFGPADLVKMRWSGVAELFDSLNASDSAEIIYVPYSSSKTAIDAATIRAATGGGRVINIALSAPVKDVDSFSIHADYYAYSRYDCSAGLLKLVKALCGSTVLVLTDVAYQTVPDEVKTRFVTVHEKIRRLTNNETGSLERMWKAGSFALKPYIGEVVDDARLDISMFKGCDDAYKFVKEFRKNYTNLSAVDRALISLFTVYPTVPGGSANADFDYSAGFEEACSIVRKRLPLLQYLTHAPEADVQLYIKLMNKFNKSTAKKGGNTHE